MVKKKISTILVRSGLKRTMYDETSEALFLTSGYVYRNAQEAEKAFKDDSKRYLYSRFGNPTVNSLQHKLSELEETESCWITATGMSAVFTIFMSYLKTGDRVVAGRALFGSCHFILTKILPNFGIDVELVDGKNIEEWEIALKKKTKIVFFESPSNPCLEIVDIEKVSRLAHNSGALVVVDNVFATPLLQKPIKLGADIVMYSATKHLDGQGRVLGGAILGSKNFCENFLKPFIRNTGPSISPFNAWILVKSLDTLELRINRQCDNTKRIVKFLDESKFVDSICYPFHQAFPQLKLAKKQMKKGGTIVSFRLKAQKNEKKKIAFNFLNNLSLIDISNNLGDSKSLITHPDTTTHSKLSSKEKNELGISQNLVRLSVGLEDVEDIIEDIETSFKKSYI